MAEPKCKTFSNMAVTDTPDNSIENLYLRLTCLSKYFTTK